MRVCEAGLEEGDPCNPKMDTAGCYETMGITFDQMEKPGFTFVDYLTDELKEMSDQIKNSNTTDKDSQYLKPQPKQESSFAKKLIFTKLLIFTLIL
jgi:hypothetical protein